MTETAMEANEEMEVIPYIIAIDIGTTSLRSHIYNKQGVIKGSSSKKVRDTVHPGIHYRMTERNIQRYLSPFMTPALKKLIRNIAFILSVGSSFCPFITLVGFPITIKACILES